MNSGNPTATAIVQRVFTEALAELLDAYGLAERIVRQDVASEAHRSSCVSVTSLTGDGVRIVSTLDLDIELLASIYPAKDQPFTRTDLEDWSREFNNQLVGRIKNKLLAHGCNTILGLPSLLVGIDISTILRGDLDTLQVVYTSAGGRLVATLATKISSNVMLDAASSASAEQGILREGAISLF